jgi:hypothetical protein
MISNDDTYFAGLLTYALMRAGTAAGLATAIQAKSGPAVQAWKRNGVSHKYRPALERVYGAAYKRAQKKAA